VVCIAEPRVIPFGAYGTYAEQFLTVVLFCRDSFCFCEKLGPVALVLERPRKPLAHRNCLPENVQFPDNCDILSRYLGSVSLLSGYPKSNIPNEYVPFGILERQENVSSPGTFIVDPLKSDLFQVRTFSSIK